MAGQFVAATIEFRACRLAEAAAASLICVREGGPVVDRFQVVAVASGARSPALGDGGGPRAVRIDRGLVGPTDAPSVVAVRVLAVVHVPQKAAIRLHRAVPSKE